MIEILNKHTVLTSTQTMHQMHFEGYEMNYRVTMWITSTFYLLVPLSLDSKISTRRQCQQASFDIRS